MSVVRNAHRQKLYNRERREGNLREREEGSGREREEGDIFPLHACSCADQLEYFSQQFQRGDRHIK